MLDPKIGRWMEEDPDGFAAGDADLYRFVGNDPTNATDPTGLQRVDANAPSQEGSFVGSEGTLSWSITAVDNKGIQFFGAGVTAEITFHPNDENKSKNISFIQVVRVTLGGALVYPGVGASYYSQFDSSTGWRVDHIQGESDPYYGARPGKGMLWIDEGGRSRPGRGPATGIPPRDAFMVDSPNRNDARKGNGDYVFMAETAAIDIDTGEVLGVVKWGFKIADGANTPVELIGGHAGDAGAYTSDDFKRAVEQANTRPEMTWKVGLPPEGRPGAVFQPESSSALDDFFEFLGQALGGVPE